MKTDTDSPLHLSRGCSALFLLIMIVAARQFAATPAPPAVPSERSAFRGIVIHGDPAFRARVHAALQLLAAQCPHEYSRIERDVPRIRQARRSGIWTWAAPPMMDIADKTAEAGTTWLAGAIAHDAVHSRAFREKVARRQFRQTYQQEIEEERRCLAYQAQVLRLIGAPAFEIEWCEHGDGTYIDLNRDGRTDWRDYLLRDW